MRARRWTQGMLTVTLARALLAGGAAGCRPEDAGAVATPLAPLQPVPVQPAPTRVLPDSVRAGCAEHGDGGPGGGGRRRGAGAGEHELWGTGIHGCAGAGGRLLGDREYPVPAALNWNGYDNRPPRGGLVISRRHVGQVLSSLGWCGAMGLAKHARRPLRLAAGLRSPGIELAGRGEKGVDVLPG